MIRESGWVVGKHTDDDHEERESGRGTLKLTLLNTGQISDQEPAGRSS